MIVPEKNKHIIKNTPNQLKRLRDAGNNASNNWNWPNTMRLVNFKRTFKRYKFI